MKILIYRLVIAGDLHFSKEGSRQDVRLQYQSLGYNNSKI